MSRLALMSLCLLVAGCGSAGETYKSVFTRCSALGNEGPVCHAYAQEYCLNHGCVVEGGGK